MIFSRLSIMSVNDKEHLVAGEGSFQDGEGMRAEAGVGEDLTNIGW